MTNSDKSVIEFLNLKAGMLSCFPFPPLLRFVTWTTIVFRLTTAYNWEGGTLFVSMNHASVSAKTVFKYIGEHPNSSCCVLGITCSFFAFLYFKVPQLEVKADSLVPL